MSDPIVGIDLGTSNTVVAHADATGNARVLADEQGFKIHPSVVSFHPNGGVVVGAAAKQRKVIDPKNTIYSVKRLIGRRFDSPEVDVARKRSPFTIKEGANQQPLIKTRAGDYAVPEISAIVLDHARNVAQAALKKVEVSRAVVTVPASFNDAQRSATATAGSIANLNVVRVLNEPTAAALAYGHTRGLHETIAVYDFGGGTFDITILKLADQVYEVLGTAGDTFLGGDDLDERLVDRMVEKFLAENRIDLRSNEVSMMRLRAVAEQTKIELSRRSRAVVKVDEIAYGPKGRPLDLKIEISRDEFVQQIQDIVDKTFPVCKEALQFAQLGNDGIDDVILVGGTTKIPYVRDEVTKFFGKAPRTDVSPEDAVALGAGLQAHALEQILSRSSHQAPFPAEDTSTFVGETNVRDPGATTEEPLDFDDVIAEATNVTPPGEEVKRTTSGYSEQMGATDAPGDRKPERGQFHDRYEQPPPAGAALARMTKRDIQPMTAAAAKPPLDESLKTIPVGAPVDPALQAAPPLDPSLRTIPGAPPRDMADAPSRKAPPPMPAARPPAIPKPGTKTTSSSPTIAKPGAQAKTWTYDEPPGAQLRSQTDAEPETTVRPPNAAQQPTQIVANPAADQATKIVPAPVVPPVPAKRSTNVGQAVANQRTQIIDAGDADQPTNTVPAYQPTQIVPAPETPQRTTDIGQAVANQPTKIVDAQAAAQPTKTVPAVAPQRPSVPPPASQARTQIVQPAPAQARTQIVQPPAQPPPSSEDLPQEPFAMPQWPPAPERASQQKTQIAEAKRAASVLTLEPAPSPASTARGFGPEAALPVVIDVTPRGLGIATVAGFCESLIRRNSRVPAEIRKIFVTGRDLQDAVRIVVVQGESRRMEGNEVLGDLTLSELTPRPRGETSIEVTFMINASGILQVRARDAQTGREQRATLDLVGAMPHDEVAASRERITGLLHIEER